MCSNILKNPILDSCGHSFCKNCLSNNWQRKCPISNSIIKYQIPNLTLRSFLSCLILTCDYCSEKIKVEKIIHHDIICKLKKDEKKTKQNIINGVLKYYEDKSKLKEKVRFLEKKLWLEKISFGKKKWRKKDNYSWGIKENNWGNHWGAKKKFKNQ